MFKNISLERPLAILDLETTGTSTENDKIVEISVLKILPDGSVDHRTRRVNPGIPIPPEATAIHGITDADIANEPTIGQHAPRLIAFLDGCDLCGFNIKKFDLQLLYSELFRSGFTLPLDDRAIVDPLEIFHFYERRDLAAAVKFYCGKEHDQAHKAHEDVLATAQILDAMVARYSGLPRNIAGLYQHFKDPNGVDLSGKFVKVHGELRFTFGKHRGQPLDTVAKTSRDYLEWMLTANFLNDTKAIVKEALSRVIPPVSSLPLGQTSHSQPDVERVTVNVQPYSDGECVYVGGFLPFTQNGPNTATVSVTQDSLNAHVAWTDPNCPPHNDPGDMLIPRSLIERVDYECADVEEADWEQHLDENECPFYLPVGKTCERHTVILSVMDATGVMPNGFTIRFSLRNEYYARRLAKEVTDWRVG